MYSIIDLQIGAAPVTPDVNCLFITELSLLPTQTVVTKSGVYPIVQLSRLLSLVPVLTETVLPGIFKAELLPKAGLRASLSERISDKIKATVSGIACTSFLLLVGKTFPFWSVTLISGVRLCLLPLFARVP